MSPKIVQAWCLGTIMLSGAISAGALNIGAPTIDAPTIGALAATAPGAEDFPAHDAIVLHESSDYSIDAQGLLTHRVRLVQKLFTEWACRNLTDSRVGWDASRQEIRILTCSTIMRDGTRVDTPPRGFNEVTPSGSSACADFLSLREMVISHVGVERGGVIELEYEVRDLVPAALPPSGLDFLQSEQPILCKQVRVSVPEDMPLNWATPHAQSVLPTDESHDGRRIVTWEVRDVGGLSREGNTGRDGDYLPHLIFSTAADWRQVAERLRQLSLAAEEVDDPMRVWLAQADGTAADIVHDLTPLDTVQRIAALIGEGTSRVATVDSWGRPPRSAAKVFTSACGTDWEKAVLALSLLRAAGFAPELGFFSRWDTFDRVVGTPLSLGAVRVVVPVSGENWWLAPDRSRALPGRCDLKGRTGLFLEDSAQQFRSYVVAPATGHCHLAVDIRPAAQDRYSVRIDLHADGLLRRSDLEKSAADIAMAIASALLEESEILSARTLLQTPWELHLRATVEGTGLGKRQDGLVMLPLPKPPDELPAALPPAFQATAAQRQTPLFLPGDLSEEMSLRLTLPEGMAVAALPPASEISAGDSRYALVVENAGNVVTVARSLQVAGKAIAPATYPEFHKMLATALEPCAEMILLRADHVATKRIPHVMQAGD